MAPASRGRLPARSAQKWHAVCVRILRPGRHEFTVTAKGCESMRVSAFLEDGKITPVGVYLRK